uniref:Putative secreted peptide n=1 Tax=Anopheles braziliensis TaxID=58242 RepID=A0A2M3ZQN3_9DIPT
MKRIVAYLRLILNGWPLSTARFSTTRSGLHVSTLPEATIESVVSGFSRKQSTGAGGNWIGAKNVATIAPPGRKYRSYLCLSPFVC